MARRRSAPIAGPAPVSAPISIWPRAKGPKSSCRSPPEPRRAAPVEDAAYAEITERICAAAAAGGFDGIMLDLHGAMVTQSLEDGEGQFLKRLRAIDPVTPIAVSLDMHANLYDEIIANATVVTGYRTYPHIDTYETAWLAGEILLRAIRGEVRPVMAWGNAPMLPHVMRQGTDDHPNKELQHRCAAMNAEGALAASLFTGFPHADITNAGLSAVVVTDGDRELAERLRDELLDRAWVEREAFVYQIEPLGAIGRPRQGDAGPAGGRRAGRAARPLRQLRLGRHDGYDRRTGRNPAPGSRRRRRLCDLRPRSGAAGDRRRHRRASDLVDRRQDRDAGDPGRKSAAERDRDGQDDFRWPLQKPRSDGARGADGYGPDGGAGHRNGRDRADLAPCRTVRSELSDRRSASTRCKSVTSC